MEDLVSQVHAPEDNTNLLNGNSDLVKRQIGYLTEHILATFKKTLIEALLGLLDFKGVRYSAFIASVNL